MDRIIQANKVKVYGSAIFFSIIVGFSFIAIKTSVVVASPIQTLAYRFNFSLLAIIIILLVKKKDIHIRSKKKKNAVINASFYLGYMVFQAVGLLYTSSVESGIMFATIPIIAKIAANFLLGESSDYKQNLFVVLSVSGVIVMFVLGSDGYVSTNVFGLVLLFLSSVSMAVSNVYMRYVRKEYTPLEITLFISVGGCILFNLAAIVSGYMKGDFWTYYFSPLHNFDFMLSCAYLGVLSTVVTAMIMAYMTANIETVKATIFGNLSTGISLVAGAVFLQEQLHFYHLICTAAIVIGVIGTSRSKQYKKSNTE